MAAIKIAVINATSDDSVLTDAEAQAAVGALQKQVHDDFAPVWGTDADLSFITRDRSSISSTVPSDEMWMLALLDTSDQATALGYHDLTPAGLPLGKVFVLSDKQSGNSWQVTASHELLEMLGDPDINLWAFPKPDLRAGRLYAYETCDACEADELGYQIDGISVSDFLYPAWFESFRTPNSTQFDKQGEVQRPFELLPGGYSLVYDISSGTGYHQIFGGEDLAQFSPALRPRVGSRRERRMTSRQHWRPSTHCGIERWPVKTLSDADAGKVNLTPVTNQTVTSLGKMERPFPADAPGPQNSRATEEQTVYTVTATLVGAKIESDRDIHLVIRDSDNPDPAATIVAEFPDPGCLHGAAPDVVAAMTQARDAILAVSPSAVQNMAAGRTVSAAALDPQTGAMLLQPMDGTAQITGVAFFDRDHGQDGRAPNVIELHPVLAFTRA